MKLRKIYYLLTPPIVPKLWKKLSKRHNQPEQLFDGDSEIFIQELKKTKVYGEYGVGTSTKYVLDNTAIPVISVDSSSEWIKNVLDSSARKDGAELHYVNLGQLKDWGTPVDYSFRRNINEYLSHIWSCSVIPDLVLIDGRFRVACFMYSLLNSPPGTRIIFDDYLPRPEYHVVEELLLPEKLGIRQALFTVPLNFNKALAEEFLNKFEYVLD